MPLVERSTNGNEQTIVLRYLAVANWLKWFLIVALLWKVVDPEAPTGSMIPIGFVIFLASVIPYLPAIFEVRRRLHAGPVAKSGSKFSFTDPLTFRWSEPTEP